MNSHHVERDASPADFRQLFILQLFNQEFGVLQIYLCSKSSRTCVPFHTVTKF
jgi:hypothetical protein